MTKPSSLGHINSQKGMGLISALVGVGILSVLIIGSIQVVVNMLQAQKNVEQRNAVDVVRGDVRAVLSEPEACRRTFGGVAVGAQVNQIRTENNQTFIARNQLLESRNIKVTRFSTGNLRITNSAERTGLADLYLDIEKNIESLGPRVFRRDILLHVEVDAGNRIVRCAALYGKSDSVWTVKLNGDIYRAGGRVGVGLSNPRSQLEVQGGVRARKGFASGDGSNVGYSFGADGNSGLFSVGGASNMNSDLVLAVDGGGHVRVKAGTGYVGIGVSHPRTRLDIAGDIKISNGGTACNGSTEGAIRYNKGAKEMEYCNGANWVPFGFKGNPTQCYHRYASNPGVYGRSWGMRCRADEYVRSVFYSQGTEMDSDDLSVECCKFSR